MRGQNEPIYLPGVTEEHNKGTNSVFQDDLLECLPQNLYFCIVQPILPKFQKYTTRKTYNENNLVGISNQKKFLSLKSVKKL